jgi:hypothetical protein
MEALIRKYTTVRQLFTQALLRQICDEKFCGKMPDTTGD